MKKKNIQKRTLKSLQAQLPLTYAGIAVITTTLIGAVLVFTIWNYYHGLEEKYLQSNLHGTINSLTSIVQENEIDDPDSLTLYSDVLQNQTNVTAFLIQSRMRVLDINGDTLADSGSPSRSWNITIPKPRNEQGQLLEEANMLDNTAQPSFSLGRSEDPSNPNSEVNPPYSIQANPNMYGFLLQDSMIEEGKRSTIVLQEAFYSTSGELLGYVELSESPAYGQRIIWSVVKGWGIASLIGLVVSITFGWFMSRKLTRPLLDLESVATEMKNGNYEIRSPVFSPDELASLSSTFNQMASHIQTNIETLQQFVSDAAHEIRTPLTVLRADLNLALAEKTLRKSKPMVERSLEQVERLDQLSRDLLDLSRLETKNAGTKFAKIDLRHLLEELSEIHASAAEQAGIAFQLMVTEDVCFVYGDEGQLYRAIGNLLDNAVKFTPVGGQVVLQLTVENSSALIQVSDTGIGIPMDEQEHLFQRFHRGKNTQRYPGSGLGLAIAKVIVEKHHGEIGLLPETEKTVFYIRIPLPEE